MCHRGHVKPFSIDMLQLSYRYFNLDFGHFIILYGAGKRLPFIFVTIILNK